MQPARAKTQSASTSSRNRVSGRLILASEREDICDLVLPNCADASSCGRERCTDTRIVTEKTDVCLVVNNTCNLNSRSILYCECRRSPAKSQDSSAHP